MSTQAMKGMETLVPQGPHLLLYTVGGPEPVAMAIVPGNNMGLVYDPKVRSHHERLVLVEVTKRRLLWRCACNPTCTVQVIMRIEEKGAHPR